MVTLFIHHISIGEFEKLLMTEKKINKYQKTNPILIINKLCTIAKLIIYFFKKMRHKSDSLIIRSGRNKDPVKS